MAQDTPASDAQKETAPPSKKKIPKTALLVGIITLIEAGGFFALMKFMAPAPQSSHAADAAANAPADGSAAGDDGHADGGHGDKKTADGGHGEPAAGGTTDKPAAGAGDGGGHGESTPEKPGDYVKSAEPASKAASAEVPVLSKFRVPNSKSGKNYIYDFDIFVIVPAGRKAEMEGLAKSRTGEIADRVAQIVRGAEAKILGEDDLQTLRAQIRLALSQIAGDDKLVQRVLIPRCVPMRAD